MKIKLSVIAALAVAAILAIGCAKKKPTDPVAVLLEAATTQLSAAKDGKTAAAAVETLVTGITPLLEKNPDLFKDRTPFADAQKSFIDVYGDAMVKYSKDDAFAAAEAKLLPLKVLN
ncbi:MAG: hypothetical protein KF713_04335 [Turneriella sp.]|nr:hypothetical protein [Turneriella sp.]